MKNKYRFIPIIIMCMSTLLTSIMVGVILSNTYAKSQYRILSEISRRMIETNPDVEQDVMKIIKESLLPTFDNDDHDNDYLASYGYQPQDFAPEYMRNAIAIIGIVLIVLLLSLYLCRLAYRRKYRKRIAELTGYLEKINLEYDASILPNMEDDFSPLQDEIYKTVMKLHQTTENAQRAQKNLADNLANISHQIKTPVASISIMAQLLDNERNHVYTAQLGKQAKHLEQLIKSLLTLSRIDAGVLKLEKNVVDIYSMLQLSIESLEELIREKGIHVNLPNHPEIMFQGDMEWSIEAFINLIKNCIEHTPQGGQINIDYSMNPLYTEVKLKDNGEGFREKDLPHIFERFYLGENAQKSGIGIGLSLAKSLIEMQGGIISAKNLAGGGACFIVRFYSH